MSKLKMSGQRVTHARIGVSDRPAEGWYYEARGSIEVYLRDPCGGDALHCRISRAKLVDWIKRTERKP